MLWSTRICRQLQKSSYLSLFMAFPPPDCACWRRAASGNPLLSPLFLLPSETWREEDRALWPCIDAHSPSCHTKCLFIPNSRWKGAKLGALQAGNVNIKLRFLCSCFHVGGEEPLWGYFGVCLCAWEAIEFLKGDTFCCCGCAAAQLEFGSLSLGEAALDQIFPLVQAEVKNEL